MPYMLVRHKVGDYAKWKSVFDGLCNTRKANGEKSYQIFHTYDSPSNLVLLFEWDNLDNARKYTQSDVLRDAMQRAGVAEQPEIHFLDEIVQASIC